jgi:hypothetical protein
MIAVLCKGQTITPADFRLCLDGYGCPDSVLKLTKKQLLSAKTISPNFSWFTITGLTFYFGAGFGTDVNVQSCTGNSFCRKLQPIIERCGPDAVLIIEATGINKSGKKMGWSLLRIRVVAE